MAAPVEQQSPDEAAELEAAVRHVIEACGRAPVDPVRALIVANGMLGQELADVYAKASDGFPARAADGQAQGYEQRATLSERGRSRTSATDLLRTPSPQRIPGISV
ncbi:ribosomal protein L12E/L44/L45/RPP1/RPP2 [Bradyrhizobium sp. LB1.3]